MSVENTHAQTMSKVRAVEEMTNATADVMAAQKRCERLEDELRQAQNVRSEAEARLTDAKAHLDRAIRKEI